MDSISPFYSVAPLNLLTVNSSKTSSKSNNSNNNRNSLVSSTSIPTKSNNNKINFNNSRTITTIFTLSHLILLGLIATLIPTVQALAPYEPAGNQVLLGAWLDTQGGKF